MSLDLNVYLTRVPDLPTVTELAAKTPGIAVDDPSGWENQHLVLTSRKAHDPIYTLEGPFLVEPEDIPEEVTARLLGASHLLTVSIHVSSETAINLGHEFARRLARAFDGAVHDTTTDEIWARGAHRVAPKPTRGDRISLVSVYWHTLAENVDTFMVDSYLNACRRYLPEALPKRYGGFEPLQHKLSDTGDDGLKSAWKTESLWLMFAASAPCIWGSFSANPAVWPQPVWSLHLDLQADPLSEPSWREGLRGLFVTFADELKCFFASAEVTRNHIWNGRSTASDGLEENLIYTARNGRWHGLKPHPTWWAYYGSDYRALVEGHLDPARIQSTEFGLFHEWTDEPTDRDTLIRMASPRPTFRRRDSWLPSDLLVTVLPGDTRQRYVEIEPAKTIPAGLRMSQEEAG
ncbi:MAG: hypothetical protein JW722_00235 [Demequinaceae bacterium]|nr:hypothetical protein [Demequinaceae bacterium]